MMPRNINYPCVLVDIVGGAPAAESETSNTENQSGESEATSSGVLSIR